MAKTVVVTGANRGIGLSFCQFYKNRGDTVYAVCRTASSALKQMDVELIEGVDVSDQASIEKLKAALAGVSIELLINNAGILCRESLGDIDFDIVRQQFEINAMGPLRVTEALLPNLTAAAKVALITSRMGSMGDNSSGGRYGYRMSKAALNSAGVSLANDLKPRGIAVAILHPGLVGTDMIGGQGDISPDGAVKRLAERIDELTVASSGSFWHASGEALPW